MNELRKKCGFSNKGDGQNFDGSPQETLRNVVGTRYKAKAEGLGVRTMSEDGWFELVG